MQLLRSRLPIRYPRHRYLGAAVPRLPARHARRTKGALSRPPLAPPLLSRVCREARYFAISRGGLRLIKLGHARAWTLFALLHSEGHSRQMRIRSRIRKRLDESVAQWPVGCLRRRAECIDILDKVGLHLHYADACDLGLWGLLRESNKRL
ncbi:hypothetical protein F4678DRAFT_436819 [Xylaria arbuscula]|nr:hypothetical protein F4678DRAFT_436819 [Xylaria arbuscula]